MDSSWVWTAVGVVGGVAFVFNYALDQVARSASRVTAAARAMKKAKAALKRSE